MLLKLLIAVGCIIAMMIYGEVSLHAAKARTFFPETLPIGAVQT